jgi:carboxylate-amine ligase
MADGTARTVGVEEETLLATPDGYLASASEMLIADPTANGRLSHELKREQIETATRPCGFMAELREQVAAEREHLAVVAARHGVLACFSGTSPHPGTATPFPGQRFSRINAEFAAMATSQLTCGMHVHVAVSSPHEGIGVVDRIRGWLPVLTALAANSPFWQGEDSGYDSYRMVVLSQLPPSGPAPVWGDLAAYQRCIDQVMATGAAFDPAMIYFDCRLSARYPTVEIRVTDVCAELDEVVLVAALCRALVDVAAQQWADGVEPLDLPVPVLRSASWRAGRHGMGEQLFDPSTGALAPAWDVVDRLVAHVRPALEANGDLDVVRRGLDVVRRRGTGADRQRAAWRSGSTLAQVLVSRAAGQARARPTEPVVPAGI